MVNVGRRILKTEPFNLCLVLVFFVFLDILSTAIALYGTNGAFFELNPLGFEPAAIFLVLLSPYALYISKKKRDDQRLNKLILAGIIIRVAVVTWNFALLLKYFSPLF